MLADAKVCKSNETSATFGFWVRVGSGMQRGPVPVQFSRYFTALLGQSFIQPYFFTVYRKSVSVSFYFLLLGYILTTDHALGERRGRNMVLPSQSLYLALLSLLRDTRIAGGISGLPADTRFAAPLSIRSAQRIGHQLL